MRQDAPPAVVLMAYGSPQRREDIGPYLAHIRSGQAPSAAAVSDLERRYDCVGGRSPLQEITRSQTAELAAELRRRGVEATVACGMKHSPPFIADAVAELHRLGARRFLGLALAPHFARMSVGAYAELMKGAAERLGEPAWTHTVPSWHLEPSLIEAWADPLRAMRRARPELAGPQAHVVFSAHSLPATITAGDPYPGQLAETCAAVAAAASVPAWSFAWQSAGTRGEWLGPPISDVLERLSAAGATAVVSAPVGFVSEHLEVLYDLDIEARAVAERCGMAWARAPMPNASPKLVSALADVVQRVLEGHRLAASG